MKQKIKAKSHGITKLDISDWSESEEQAINDIGKNFEFHENFNLPEQILHSAHLIKYIAMMRQSNPSIEQKISYIQQIVLTLNHLILLFSVGRMGSSIKDELTPKLKIYFEELIDIFHTLNHSPFDGLTDIFHSLNASLFETLKNLSAPQIEEEKQNSGNDDLPTKAEIKKIAIEYLCRVFLAGSTLHPRLTSDTDSSENRGELYEFFIKIRPLFEIKSGIKLGSDSSIGRDLFDARKKARKYLEKSK